MNNTFDNNKFDNIIEGPYTLYGSGVTFNNNSIKNIISNRKIYGDIPLYPMDNLPNIQDTNNFLVPMRTKEHKSANNISSIDYNRWEVFVDGKKNPVTTFEFMDNNLGR